MDMRLIKIMKSLNFCENLIIRNFLVMIKYKITDLKHSPLPTGILHKNCNAIMEEPDKVPDC
jgi:hypothetical protein